MKIKLLNCPHCERVPRLEKKSGVVGRVCRTTFYRGRVVCKCGAGTQEFKSPGRAEKCWNTRGGVTPRPILEEQS